VAAAAAVIAAAGVAAVAAAVLGVYWSLLCWHHSRDSNCTGVWLHSGCTGVLSIESCGQSIKARLEARSRGTVTGNSLVVRVGG
jgi:hypothetical protein